MDEIFRKIQEAFGKETPDNIEASPPDEVQQQRLLGYAEFMLTSLFVHGQVRNSDIENLQQGNIPEDKELFERSWETVSLANLGIEQMNGKSNRDLMDLAEERILDAVEVNQKVKEGIKLRALYVGLDYWERRLEDPDVTSEEAEFAKNRIPWLTGRLKNVTGNQEG